MMRRFGTLALISLFATAAGLFIPSSATAAPLCYGGHVIFTGTTPIGCLFFDPNWGSDQAYMCNGNTTLHSDYDGACHVCVPDDYVDDVQSGNWSIFSVSSQSPTDFRCVSCANPAPGLAAWWNFDEVDPGIAWEARDIYWSGYLYGEHFNGPTPTPLGRFSYALRFDGINDYVEVWDDPALDFGASPGGDFTVAAWVRVGPADIGGVRTILDKRVPSPTRGYSFFLYNGRPGVQLADGNGYGNYIANQAVPANNEWYQVVISVSRTNGATFYISGYPLNLTPVSVAQRPGSLANSSNLRIGSRSFEVGGLFKGMLDEVQIFNRALSTPEVQGLARGTCEPSW